MISFIDLKRRKKIKAILNIIVSLLEEEGRLYDWKERTRKKIFEVSEISYSENKLSLPYKPDERVKIGLEENPYPLIQAAVTGSSGLEYYRNRKIVGRDERGEYLDLNLNQTESIELVKKIST